MHPQEAASVTQTTAWPGWIDEIIKEDVPSGEGPRLRRNLSIVVEEGCVDGPDGVI